MQYCSVQRLFVKQYFFKRIFIDSSFLVFVVDQLLLVLSIERSVGSIRSLFSVIFRFIFQSLKLSNSAKQETTTGEIVNLVNTTSSSSREIQSIVHTVHSRCRLMLHVSVI